MNNREIYVSLRYTQKKFLQENKSEDGKSRRFIFVKDNFTIHKMITVQISIILWYYYYQTTVNLTFARESQRRKIKGLRIEPLWTTLKTSGAKSEK